ncbi:hypothetical protein STPH1_7078 [Streptomyces sp. OM5714]|nr:hypothetical protein STPH1_7078 [Streptomyces sp. OM5714]
MGCPIAHRRTGGCATGLRSRSSVVRSRVVLSGCAVRPRVPDPFVRRFGCRTAQALARPLAATVCALVRGSGGRAAGRLHRGHRCRLLGQPCCAGSHSWLIHGRVCGRADHGSDHGLRVPIVTVVGGSWSVVGSGPAGSLKVRNSCSDLGV